VASNAEIEHCHQELSRFGLPETAHVGHERHEVTSSVSSREIRPLASLQIDPEAAERAICSRRIERLVLSATSASVRQKVPAEFEGVRPRGLIDGEIVDRAIGGVASTRAIAQ
jgi:hypothetical protein